MRDVTPDDLVGPIGHSVVWTVIGAVVLAGALALGGWAWWPARRREPAAVVAEPADPEALKRRYLERIGEIERAHLDRRLDDRTLHLQLSATLRAFATDLSSARATAMTPEQLRAAGLEPIAGIITASYPPQFERRRDGDPAGALSSAREVVSTWN